MRIITEYAILCRFVIAETLQMEIVSEMHYKGHNMLSNSATTIEEQIHAC